VFQDHVHLCEDDAKLLTANLEYIQKAATLRTARRPEREH
jgi:hypothetical protein